MTKIILTSKTSDRDFSAIQRFAANVTRYWPEFSGAEINVERSRDEHGVSVDGCDELNCVKLQAAVCNELEVLRYTASIGW